MKVNSNILYLDIKVQDRFRNAIANLANGTTKLTCVQLGDSDIDYENSTDINSTKVINAPFNAEGVKYPLVYDGSGRGLEGYSTCFARKINSDGSLSSTYNFPSNDTFTPGQTVPALSSGEDRTSLVFDNTKMGYVLFFQTILSNYVDTTSSLLMRLNEVIHAKVTFAGSEAIPTNWQVIQDTGFRIVSVNGVNYKLFNNSISIAKNATGPLFPNTDGLVTVTGALSNITKKINFNI